MTIQDNKVIGTKAILYKYAYTFNVVIPQGIEAIGSHAFADQKGLTAVTMPESLDSIGEGAFKGCNQITSVRLPKHITRIEPMVFNGCSRLTEVKLPDGEGERSGEGEVVDVLRVRIRVMV